MNGSITRPLLAALLLPLGCSTITELGTDGSTGEAPTPAGTTTGFLPTSTAGQGEASSAGSGSTTTSSSSGAADPSLDDTGCFFGGCGPDVPPIPECDIWNDDCPRGEKCTYWSNNGGATLNSTRCVPLHPDPAAPGEPCTAESIGFDDCEAGSMCWDFHRYPQGVCIAFCLGERGAPSCADEASQCTVTGGGVAMCRPRCNPLDPASCPEGHGCYPIDPLPLCGPDASGDGGALLEPCEYTNACDPGLLCASAEEVGLCPEGASSCCTPYCDLTAPTCPEGTQCNPLFESGSVPPEYEDVGICGS